jgi:hypothetical protein
MVVGLIEACRVGSKSLLAGIGLLFAGFELGEASLAANIVLAPAEPSTAHNALLKVGLAVVLPLGFGSASNVLHAHEIFPRSSRLWRNVTKTLITLKN